MDQPVSFKEQVKDIGATLPDGIRKERAIRTPLKIQENFEEYALEYPRQGLYEVSLQLGRRIWVRPEELGHATKDVQHSIMHYVFAHILDKVHQLEMMYRQDDGGYDSRRLIFDKIQEIRKEMSI